GLACGVPGDGGAGTCAGLPATPGFAEGAVGTVIPFSPMRLILRCFSAVPPVGFTSSSCFGSVDDDNSSSFSFGEVGGEPPFLLTSRVTCVAGDCGPWAVCGCSPEETFPLPTPLESRSPKNRLLIDAILLSHAQPPPAAQHSAQRAHANSARPAIAAPPTAA
ncbi:uncharacterized protein Tco025E_08802, partial [Trypanosoma conorhini]